MTRPQMYREIGNSFCRLMPTRGNCSLSWRTISHTLETTKQVITTNGSEVLCKPQRDTSHLAPCDHEEADTRMILHLADAVKEGFRKTLLRTVDTDVVVLAVAGATKLNIDELELWVAFGTAKKFRYIPAHEIAVSLGPDMSQALPIFSRLHWV